MHVKELFTEQGSDRLSKSAIMLWITFGSALGYWLTGAFMMKAIPAPDGLLAFLTMLLGYNVVRRGTDKVSDVVGKIKGAGQFHSPNPK